MLYITSQGYKQKNAFIVTQAPMKSTKEDFWKMVYEKECAIIVMLSGLEELDEVINWRVNNQSGLIYEISVCIPPPERNFNPFLHIFYPSIGGACIRLREPFPIRNVYNRYTIAWKGLWFVGWPLWFSVIHCYIFVLPERSNPLSCVNNNNCSIIVLIY